jgi:hypothetical protein
MRFESIERVFQPELFVRQSETEAGIREWELHVGIEISSSKTL